MFHVKYILFCSVTGAEREKKLCNSTIFPIVTRRKSFNYGPQTESENIVFTLFLIIIFCFTFFSDTFLSVLGINSVNEV